LGLGKEVVILSLRVGLRLQLTAALVEIWVECSCLCCVL